MLVAKANQFDSAFYMAVAMIYGDIEQKREASIKSRSRSGI